MGLESGTGVGKEAGKILGGADRLLSFSLLAPPP